MIQHTEVSMEDFNALGKALTKDKLLKRRDNSPSRGDQTYYYEGAELAIVTRIKALTLTGKVYDHAVIYMNEDLRGMLLDKYSIGGNGGNTVKD